MVLLNDDFICNFFKKKKHSSTHLFLNNKRIHEVGLLSKCQKITTLYLYNNQITKLENIQTLKNLTHLYLQWNSIISLKQFNDLPSLTHLYIGYNNIETLDGLKKMPNLKLIHIQNQKLSSNCSGLSFEDDTLQQLAMSVKELNVSGNSISAIEKLENLSIIENLDVSNNLITNLKHFCNSIVKMKALRSLDVKGNPITKNVKYKSDIMASASMLGMLDGTIVPQSSRLFLQSLKAVREKNRLKKKQEKIKLFSSETRSFIQDLPLELRETVSRSIIHNRRN